MCGIVGIVQFRGQVDCRQFEDMTSAIAHRGPDDEGYLFANRENGNYVIAGGRDTPRTVFESTLQNTPRVVIDNIPNAQYDLAMSNRRLAILDLSPAGHQPMANDDKSIWIVYNGEIYNYREIREELTKIGYTFFSDSDTEVIIKAYEEWDLECLNKFNGMWAFCIWDVRKKLLFCARDRLGIKPFYYSLTNDFFVFGSEIKSLLKLNIPKKPNDMLIYDFLSHGLLDHTSDTFFEGIRKLPQAHFMLLDAGGNVKTKRYWDLTVSNDIDEEYDKSTYAKEFLELFTDAVRVRLRSDVPVGSCLSGGLDSSSIVCVANSLMFPDDNRSAYERHKTFSSCFEEKAFDEREYIEKVLQKTRSENNYVFPRSEQFLMEIDNLLWHQEEPFGGTSIYAQWCVLKRAREKGVIVMLDGQGADEQLGGYRKFYIFYFLELLKRQRYFKASYEIVKFLSSSKIIGTLHFREGLKYFDSGKKMFNVDSLLGDAFKGNGKIRELNFGYPGNLGNRIRDDIFKFSLPVLLRYEDKNSMAHSVEARLPFLDYRVVEKLASFPLMQKMQNGWTKVVLRNAMSGILPETIRRRKSKLGFVTPEEIWFKGRMSKEVKDIFESSRFIEGYADKRKLSFMFDKYLSSKTLYFSDLFFRFFILELWGRKFIL